MEVGVLQEGGAGDTETSGPPAATEAADFVLEVGTEEIPPAELTAVLRQLRDKVAALLEGSRLGHGAVDVQGTPRRLMVRVAALAPRQETVTEERRGPPRARAFDDAGNPTKALLGFCRGCGADAAGVFFKADKKVCWGCAACGTVRHSEHLLRSSAATRAASGSSGPGLRLQGGATRWSHSHPHPHALQSLSMNQWYPGSVPLWAAWSRQLSTNTGTLGVRTHNNTTWDVAGRRHIGCMLHS